MKGINLICSKLFLSKPKGIFSGNTNRYKQIYETLGVNDKIVKWDDTDCMVHWYWKEKKLHIGNDLEKHNGDTDYHPGYFGHIEIAKKLHKWIVEYYKPKLI